MEAAIRERTRNDGFKSLEDYCGRLDSRAVNRKTLENLIRAGAFDFIGVDRAELFARIDQALAAGASVQKDKASGQVSLSGDFDLGPAPKPTREAVSYTPWTLAEKLSYEKELLGFYVTGHPLDAYRDLINGSKYVALRELTGHEDKSTVQVAGTISAAEKKFTKKEGKPFAILCLEDFTGQAEVMVWGEVYAKAARHLEKGKIVAISAKLDRREENARLVANEVSSITQGHRAVALTIDIPYEKADEDRLRALRNLVQQFPGTQPLFLRIRRLDGQELRLKADDGFAMRDDASFREDRRQSHCCFGRFGDARWLGQHPRRSRRYAHLFVGP